MQIELQIGTSSHSPQLERKISRPGRDIEHAQSMDLELPGQSRDLRPQDAGAGAETVQTGQPAQGSEVPLTVQSRIIHDFRLTDPISQPAEGSQLQKIREEEIALLWKNRTGTTRRFRERTGRMALDSALTGQ
ncbi:MAG TPA: hypothetical protein VM165_13820 [Planctomycetaceae bacterium]|nr:hypothetical protein [Planctomycetaceae bacterium]